MTKMLCLSFVLSLTTAACGGDNGDSDLPVQNRAVIVAGDFTPGSPGVMSSLDMETAAIEQGVAPTGAVGDDPIVRRFGDELFIVNRSDGNNITILDAVTLELVEQLATGAGSNPQDVTVVGDELYVPALGTSGVVVVQRGTGAIRQIDLSSLDTVDGVPDCASVIKVGDDVFVACGRLDNFVASEPGIVAVLDTAAADAVTTFELVHPNPFGVFEQMPGGDLVIPTVPDFGDFSTGCIERISLAGAPTASCAITNAEMGGLAGRIDFDANEMFFVVASFGANGAIGEVQGLDLTTDEHLTGFTPATQVVVDFSICPGHEMVIADATMAANGLRIYGEDGTEVTSEPLAIGLKPGSAHGISCY